MHILIDGDILPYSIGFVFNNPESQLHVAKLALNRRVEYLEEFIKSRFKNSSGTRVKKTTIFLTDESVKNYRYKVAKVQPYKGNRVGSEKPKFFYELKDELIKRKNSVVVTGIEADDEMGIVAMKNPQKSIIVSTDKDMRMIPCWHWEMDQYRHPYLSDERGYVSLEYRKGNCKLFGTGEMWLMAQMLMGDKADNIPGLKGFGDKKTYEWLTSQLYPTMDEVKVLYRLLGYSQRFNEVRELLWILRTRKEETEKRELLNPKKGVASK